MPKKWRRTKEQSDYLDRHVSLLAQARKDNRLQRFKNDLYEGWFRSWPEEAEVFGETWKKGDPMTHDNIHILGVAIQKRKEQLYNYVRWHANGKVVRSRASGILTQFINRERKAAKRSRRNHKLELYSKKYYETRFMKHVEKEVVDTTPPDESKKEYKKRWMAIYHKWRLLAWEMESEQVKEEIEASWKSENAADKNLDDEESTDGESDLDHAEYSGYGGCIDQLGELLTSFLRELQDETGWAFTILGGGLNQEGVIKMVTSTVGKTTAGSTFPDICNNYQESVLQEFFAFLKIRHPIEKCLHAQANNVSEDSPSLDNDSETSQANADGHQHQETVRAIETGPEKENSSPPTKNKRRRKERARGGDVIEKPMGGGMMYHVGTGVDSHFSELSGPAAPASDVSMQDSSMDASTLSHVGAVPALLQNDSFQPGSLLFPQLYPMSSTPSLGCFTSTHTTASSFGYSAPTASKSGLYLPDNNWMPCAPPSYATPMMHNVSLPDDELSPMSRVLVITDPNRDACDPMSSVDSSWALYNANIGSTTMTPTTTLPSAAFMNPGLTNNMNLQLPTHTTTSLPNPILVPRDLNSHLGQDSTSLSNNPSSCIPTNMTLNGAIGTCSSSTILTSEPENNATEANVKGDKGIMGSGKSHKRTRKDEVDAAFVLPEGTTRAHKPRQMADDTCWEGLARKRQRKKV